MAQIAVTELKATLSEQLRRVRAGEELVVTDRGVPVARIVPCGSGNGAILDLVSAGLARMPSRGLPADFLAEPPVGPAAGALAALLAERGDTR